MTETEPDELAPWTLVFEDVTNQRSREPTGIPAEYLEPLRALSFTAVGVTRGRLRSGDRGHPVIAEVMASPGRDAFASSGSSVETGVCETELMTLFDDGTVVSTSSQNDTEIWRKFGTAIRAAHCDGYDFAVAPRGIELEQLLELHQERVLAHGARGAKPIAHQSLEQYLELRRALSRLRAERRRFQSRFAVSFVRVLFVSTALAAVLLVTLRQGRASVIALVLLAITVVLAPRLNQLAEHRLGPVLFLLLRPKQSLRLSHAKALGPYR